MYKLFVISVFVGIAALTVYFYRAEKSSGYDRNVLVFTFALTFYCIFGVIYHDNSVAEQNRIKAFAESGFITVNETRPNKSVKPVEITTVTGVALRKTLWVSSPSDVYDLVDALKRKDAAYLDQMVFDGRAHWVFVDTRVLRSPSGLYESVVFITFLEGQYTNQRGYTFAKCVPLEDEYLANDGKMYIPDSRQ